MPGKRWDGLSGFLNFFAVCLVVYTFLGPKPFDTVSAQESLPITPITFQPAGDCQSVVRLPDEVSPYLEFAEDCLTHSTGKMKLLEGDMFLMFTRLNEVRAQHGLNPLIWHDGAADAARLHAMDMVRRDYFDHASPEGLRAIDRLRRVMRDEVFGYSAENLASYKDNPTYPFYESFQLQSQLENSPSHLRNMLNDTYTHVGLAIVKRGSTYMAVQEFLTPGGVLESEWPEQVYPGMELILPKMVGDQNVGGWELRNERGERLARSYDRRVVVPNVSRTERVRLIVLAEENRSYFVLMNGPVADFVPYAP